MSDEHGEPNEEIATRDGRGRYPSSDLGPSGVCNGGRSDEGVAGDAPAGGPTPCVATANINGTCANYRWHNFCSGYIWLYSGPWQNGDEVGQSFRQVDGLPRIEGSRTVKRTIVYIRNTVPGYGQTIDILLNRDTDNDGCAESSEPIIASHLNLDPAERWNCSNFNALIPSGTQSLIVSMRHHGGGQPHFATDGATRPGPPHSIQCPLPIPHSFYYGVGRSVCLPWVGPLNTYDSWPIWLVIDGNCSTPTEETSWGRIKGLYHQSH